MIRKKGFTSILALCWVLLLAAGVVAAEPVELTLMFRGGELEEQLVGVGLPSLKRRTPISK